MDNALQGRGHVERGGCDSKHPEGGQVGDVTKALSIGLFEIGVGLAKILIEDSESLLRGRIENVKEALGFEG